VTTFDGPEASPDDELDLDAAPPEEAATTDAAATPDDDAPPDDTATPDDAPESAIERQRRAALLAARAREEAEARMRQAERWVGETAGRRRTFDLAVAMRDRDRDAFASVLGSALALRLFLFSASLIVAIMTLLNLIFGAWGIESVMEGAGLTSEMATQIGKATEANTGRDLGVFLSSAFVALWAGRSLTIVLAACSVGAWRMDSRIAKASPRVVLRVTALISLLIIAASGLNRLRDNFGIAVATGSLALNVAILGAGWFFVTLVLPRPTRDPGSMLPGAAIFAVALTLVQWFMHYYLPYKIESASETMGSLGVTVASLGYLFAVGRLMAGCVVVNAVLWEHFGSISDLVFKLPWLNRVPVRFPKVAAFFDLDHEPPPARARRKVKRKR
jgi:hypothetical protein